MDRILKDGLFPWADEKYGEGNWSFTQDGAPSHTSKFTQAFLRQNNTTFLEKDFWPPSSPDANPMDFCLWSVLEEMPCKKSYKCLEDLKVGLVAAWDEISMETVRAAVDAVQKHLQRIVKAAGGHIE